MTMMRGRLLLAFVILVSANGCLKKERTMLVVQVGSNLAVPGELDEVDLSITANGKTQHIPCSLINGYAIPLQIGIVEGGDGASTVSVVATGSLTGSTVVDEEADVSFIHGKSMLLKLFLAAECRGNPCADPNQTCTTGGRCRSKTFDPGELTPFDPSAIYKPKDAAPANIADAGGDAAVVDEAATDNKEVTSPEVRDRSSPEVSPPHADLGSDLRLNPDLGPDTTLGRDLGTDLGPDAKWGSDLGPDTTPSPDVGPDIGKDIGPDLPHDVTSPPPSNCVIFSGTTGNPPAPNTTAAFCLATCDDVQGWVCNNFAGRTMTINGVATACSEGVSQPGLTKKNGYNVFRVSAGTSTSANIYWWGTFNATCPAPDGGVFP